MKNLIEQAKRCQVFSELAISAITANKYGHEAIEAFLCKELNGKKLEEELNERAAKVTTFDPLLTRISELEVALSALVGAKPTSPDGITWTICGNLTEIRADARKVLTACDRVQNPVDVRNEELRSALSILLTHCDELAGKSASPRFAYENACKVLKK